MPSNQISRLSADAVTSEVTQAAESLVQLWGQAVDGYVPRIPLSQVRVLSALARQGPMNLTNLAQTVGIIASSTNRLCDRLEVAGLLDRRANPDQRQEITVNLSIGGREFLQAFTQTRSEDFAVVLARMSPTGRAALLQGLPSSPRSRPDRFA